MNKQSHRYEGIYFNPWGKARKATLINYSCMSDAITYARRNHLSTGAKVEVRTDTFAILSSSYTGALYLIREMERDTT